MRALLFFLLIIVVFLLIRSVFKRQQPHTSQPATDAKQTVSCHYCGLYLPKEEAIKDDQVAERYFCSEAHKTLSEKSSD